MALGPAEIVDRWIKAFNAGDADAMVALYADNAVHTTPKLRAADPATDGRLAGKPALTDWWRATFDRSPDLRYEVVTTVSNERIAVIEYLRIKPGEATMRVAELFEVEAGKIIRSHVFHG